MYNFVDNLLLLLVKKLEGISKSKFQHLQYGHLDAWFESLALNILVHVQI